jgi:Tfp pilus assembly protein PilF
MSLITDLLSKIKQDQSKRDVPPILRDAVVESNSEKRMQKRLILALVIVLVFAAIGIGAIYLMDYFKETSLIASIPEKKIPANQPPPQVSVPLQKSEPEVKAPEAHLGDQKETETVVARGREKDSKISPHRTKSTMTRYAYHFKPKVSGTVGELQQHEAASAAERHEQQENGEEISRHDKNFFLYGARTYEMQGKYSQALSNYKKVLALEPNNYIVMNNISSMLIYLRSYEEAIRYAQKALNINKNYPSPLINIGIGYGYLGKVSESERYFQRALAIEPSNHNALLNLGILYEKQNSLNKADGYYIKLSDTGDVQGYLGRARIAEKQKRMADAIYYYRLVVSMDAGDSQVSNTARERLLQLAK